jgi:hypothetical protein
MNDNHHHFTDVSVELQCIKEGMVTVDGTSLTDANEVVSFIDIMQLEPLWFGPHQSPSRVPKI